MISSIPTIFMLVACAIFAVQAFRKSDLMAAGLFFWVLAILIGSHLGGH